MAPDASDEGTPETSGPLPRLVRRATVLKMLDIGDFVLRRLVREGAFSELMIGTERRYRLDEVRAYIERSVRNPKSSSEQ